MDWTVIGTGIAIVGLIYAYLRNFKLDMDDRFNKMNVRLDKMDERFESWRRHDIAMHAEQTKRTDQLYQMFIDLLKERKG